MRETTFKTLQRCDNICILCDEGIKQCDLVLVPISIELTFCRLLLIFLYPVNCQIMKIKNVGTEKLYTTLYYRFQNHHDVDNCRTCPFCTWALQLLLKGKVHLIWQEGGHEDTTQYNTIIYLTTLTSKSTKCSFKIRTCIKLSKIHIHMKY